MRSLQTRYRGVLADGRPDLQPNSQNFAESTPQNYLEKIFQVPFVLPGMTSAGFQQLMKSLATCPATAATPPAKSEQPAADEPAPEQTGVDPTPHTPAPMAYEEHSEVGTCWLPLTSRPRRR